MPPPPGRRPPPGAPIPPGARRPGPPPGVVGPQRPPGVPVGEPSETQKATDAPNNLAENNPTPSNPGNPALAYSAVTEKSPADPIAGAPEPRQAAETTAAPSLSKESPVSGQGTSTRRPGAPARPAKSGAAPRSGPTPGTNTLAIWAMVLSVLGCVSPVGLYLGYRARGQIRRTRQYGEAFAQVAIVVGWAYIVAAVVAIIAYVLLLVLR
ncbi:DUF4190 domain-containing protein [Gordonia sp. VNQ95]|uniref:DUF4190 domain-containing protein n=1 Tax=Gordonia sp. VNQ95 TaxID=3156619 RepID=UPI0032B30F6C